VAFATTGAIEANLKIFKGILREILTCPKRISFLGDVAIAAERDGNFIPALRYAQSSGIPDEALFSLRRR